jgi:nitrile hydratase subunit beta
VRLSQSSLWPDYEGRPSDVVELEIFEHWLEPIQLVANEKE